MLKGFARTPLLWPAIALVALLILNAFLTPGFLSVRVQDGHLYGSVIDILRNGAPTLLVALGMTLVIASRGIDLSVGAVVAISGALACSHIAAAGDPASVPTVFAAMGIALAVAAVLGLWNGMLVAALGIQPIIATLVLMTAGRGIALFVTEGQIITVTSPPFKVLGAGFFLGLPVAILVSLAVFVLIGLLTRRTALGTLLEAVGINPEASRLAGVRSRTIVFAIYVFCALCAGIAGLMIASNISAADANNAGLWIEMDAILAVVIGGTSLLGGRYSLTGTLLGALIIQTLTTTVYTVGIRPEVTLVFKSLVVVSVVLLQSAKFRALFGRRRTRRRAPVPAVEIAAAVPDRPKVSHR
ncbi:ABC transporter permease [Mycolicibacterium smegmatis]|uniref:ABC transporter permease n=1 Tax=Mycolicibacterium smegmatis TaxID=1772 RepID=UPI0005D98E2C|nr:ABC transporter permease [Mycolicibacterium smegmatis]MDF1900587.1 ABC transporter permease [Mycolicibacterium smegmatis]MDF1906525.1 ABC transporter permease [Mycolicibacterium smegmatis]MDF1919800.1 ABC transporter permease [Mycolicibacterium smegmatis]MDF1927994.1 ABC transporter permease [Mycolicibacterium smegmatis]UGT77415.1 ABC transporter permease [Mycolicibacterium smegmatis]